MKVRNVTLTVCLLASCVWCAALVSRVDSAEPSAGAFKPVASVEGLMTGQVLVFKQIGKLLANKEAPHRGEQIHDLAQALAELANVNTLNSDKSDYQGWAGELRDAAMDLSAAAKQDVDGDKMGQIINRMKAACGKCHDAYQ